MLRPICQRDGDRICPVDDMKIGDDVPLLVPDKPRSGPLRDLKEIERPGVSLNRRIRDIDYGFRCPLEHGHRGPLIRAQLGGRGHHDARLPLRPVVSPAQRLPPLCHRQGRPETDEQESHRNDRKDWSASPFHPDHSPMTWKMSSLVRDLVSKSTTTICCQVPSNIAPSRKGMVTDGPC